MINISDQKSCCVGGVQRGKSKTHCVICHVEQNSQSDERHGDGGVARVKTLVGGWNLLLCGALLALVMLHTTRYKNKTV